MVREAKRSGSSVCALVDGGGVGVAVVIEGVGVESGGRNVGWGTSIVGVVVAERSDFGVRR